MLHAHGPRFGNSLANACVSQLYAAVQAALATIWICVALGTALGLSQRFGSRATDAIRSFAVVSAGLVALVVLLPHAIESEGLWGLIAGAAAFAAIPLVERLGGLGFRGLPTRTVRLEVGFVGLMLHRFADGVAMRVEGHGTDVLFALGSHEIPIVALVTLSYLDRGLATALLRAALLGAASTLGCVVIDVLPGALRSLHGYADALAAGILGHIVVHELSVPPPSATAPRGLDVLGAAVAGVILWLPSSGEDAHGALGPVLLDWLLASAPAASLGLLAWAIIVATRKSAKSDPRTPPLATPDDIRPENVALSFALLGWRLAALRLAGGCVVTLSIAIARRSGARPVRAATHARETAVSDFAGRLWDAACNGSARLVVWLGLGAVVAAYMGTFVSEGAFHQPGSWRTGLGVIGLWIVARSSAAGATPIAAALLAKGLPPGAALAGLWLGLATSASTGGALYGSLGATWSRFLMAVLALAGLGIAAALAIPAAPNVTADGAPAHAWAFLALMALICAAAMIRTGVRGWLASGLGIRVGEALHAHETLGLPATVNAAERSPAADAGRI